MDKVLHKKLAFVGIGAPRCGTTWVFECLNEHPEIFLPSIKETSFFSRNNHYKRGIEWFRNYFKDSPGGALLGEFSTEYFTHPEVIPRLLEVNPDIKILVCLRHPIERCFSHYQYSLQTTLRGKSLRYAIETGHYAVGCSFYYRHLKLFLESIPRVNIHVSIIEEGIQNPKRYIQDIYKFLEVESSFIPESLYKKINDRGRFHFKFPIIHRLYMLRLSLRGYRWWGAFAAFCVKAGIYTVITAIYEWNIVDDKKTKTDLPVLSPEDREILRIMFYDEVTALGKLIGKDLSLWDMNPKEKV